MPPVPPLPKGKQVKFASGNGSGTKDGVTDKNQKAAATATASAKQANNETLMRRTAIRRKTLLSRKKLKRKE